MINIFSIVAPIFCIFILGNFLKRINLIDADFVERSNSLIYYVFLPVLLFLNISRSDFFQVFDMTVYLMMIAVTILAFVISFIWGKFRRYPRRVIGTMAINNFKANLAYVGLPVCFYAFGAEGLATASVLMGLLVPIINILAILALNFGTKKTLDVRKMVLDILFNPLIIGCVLGIAFSLGGISLPVVFLRALEIINGLTLPLALLAIGATLDFQQFNQGSWPIVESVIIKLIFLPLAGWLFLFLFSVDIQIEEKIALILLAMPSATVNYVFVSAFGGDARLANGIIVASTVFSLLTIFVGLSLLGV